MIKYTILYKNGKTWSGKAARLNDVAEPASDAVLMWVKGEAGHSVYMPGVCSSWVGVPSSFRDIKQRKPNPASKTKKQKKFDEDYAKWADKVLSLVGGGGADTSIKTYKKWLYEQKKEWKVHYGCVLPEEYKSAFDWEGVYKLWKEAKLYNPYSYDKTNYSFWLGKEGSDE